ncbi:alkaline-phosphatase-like protein [Gaertneriomyces semiglobifer]|nr:alkaline-phosphatase-like protein [Gaertneriomyces semiglobifer]
MKYRSLTSWSDDEEEPFSLPKTTPKRILPPEFLRALSVDAPNDASHTGTTAQKSFDHGRFRVSKTWVAFGAAMIVMIIGAAVLVITRNNLPNNNDAETERTLLLISLDGFRAEYLDRGLTPTLREIARSGLRADSLKPAFPSITFPNHYSIVTGLYPEAHGIVANVFFDSATNDTFVYANPESNKDAKWWGGEPIWVTAEKQGVRAATCMWPGSEAPIKDTRPSYSLPYNHSLSIFDKADHLLQWLDKPAAERPTLLTLYVSEVDSAGHNFGTHSKELNASLTFVDKGIRHLLEGLDGRGLTSHVNIMITSDHGMMDSSNDRLIFLDDYIDLNHVALIENRPLLGLYAASGNDIGSVHQKLKEASETSGMFKVWSQQTLPEEYHYRHASRVPTLIALPNPGWAFAVRATYDMSTPYEPIGMHGYDPEHIDMHGIFIANGPVFRAEKEIQAPVNVELYNVMCEVLRISCAPNNGSVDWLEDFKEKNMLL